MRRAAILRARRLARRTVHRLDNRAVADARRMVRRLRQNPPDVLYVGDSQSIWVDPDDGDPRSVAQIIGDELGPDLDLHTMAYAGYHNQLHEAYLRFVEATDARPLVLIDMGIRVTYQIWIEHPVHGHQRALAWLEGIDPATPWWRIRAGFPRPGPEAWEQFYGTPHPTLLGDLTVGEYVRPLKNGALSPEEHQRLMYAYYHGAPLRPDDIGIANTRNVGRRLRKLGCKAVAYHGPMPIERCVELFGPSIVAMIEGNFQLIRDAYREGLGDPGATVLHTGTEFGTDEFLDDGSEHLNGRGRQRFGRIIADAIKAELERQ